MSLRFARSLPPRASAPSCTTPAPAGPPAAGPHGDFTLRVSLRAPAMRWAAAAIVAVAGRCTVVARMDPAPPAAPASEVAIAQAAA